MFFVATVRAFFELRQKEKELSSLSESARKSYEGLFSQFKLFLFVTVLVAFSSIATVVLPTELMLHQWQQGKSDYAVYSECYQVWWGVYYVHKVILFTYNLVYYVNTIFLC